MKKISSDDIKKYWDDRGTFERINAKKFMVDLYGKEELKLFFGENINVIAPVFQKKILEILETPMVLEDEYFSSQQMLQFWFKDRADEINRLFGVKQ